jgi:LysR family transcriptional regulator, glycine cleavage system transcriptional activator
MRPSITERMTGGVIFHRLIGEEIALICAPAYRERRRLREPRDLERHVLLQHARRPNAWREWLDAHQVHGNASAGPRFEHMYVIMQAAAAGLGWDCCRVFSSMTMSLRGA